jgi:hypothetical protein
VIGKTPDRDREERGEERRGEERRRNCLKYILGKLKSCNWCCQLPELFTWLSLPVSTVVVNVVS